MSMGLGFGWMPAYLVEGELSRGVLREVPYEGGSRYAFAPMLVHPRDRPLGRAGAMLLSLLGETWGVRAVSRNEAGRRAAEDRARGDGKRPRSRSRAATRPRKG